MLTATCFNSGALLATRFFLGFLESAIGPGLTVIIAMWYSKELKICSPWVAWKSDANASCYRAI